jgi:hypothetical protein
MESETQRRGRLQSRQKDIGIVVAMAKSTGLIDVIPILHDICSMYDTINNRF